MQKRDRSHFLLSNGRLSRQDNNLYFERYDDEGKVVNKKVLPIRAIDEIYVLAKVDIDSYTLAFLADNNVLLHFFSPYQSFRGNFYPNSPNSVNKSGFVLLQQVRAFDNPKQRLYIAKAFTKAQILNGAYNCHKRGVEFDESGYLEALEKAESIAEIMAVEGAFKKAYYQAWNQIIKDRRSFKFVARSKRPPTDKINAMISYVNTRIYNVVLSEIYKTELDPRIGYLHEPNYRRLSLHLDVAEIFKPIIGDNLIFWLINTKQITASSFETSGGRIRFKKEAIKTIETAMIGRLTDTINIGSQTLTWRQVIRREINHLKRCICEYAPYEPFFYGKPQ
jgi:CRISPR-associated protein Cas1